MPRESEIYPSMLNMDWNGSDLIAQSVGEHWSDRSSEWLGTLIVIGTVSCGTLLLDSNAVSYSVHFIVKKYE